jgi:hypothetical protein
MPLQNLTPPPPAPQRTDDADTFVTKADTFVAWYSTFVGEMNTLTTQLMVTTALIGVAPAYSDDGLRVMAGNAPAANTFIYFSGTASSALATLTPFARTILDDADAPAMRSTLGLSPFSQNEDQARIATNGTIGAILDGFQTLHVSAGLIPSSGRLRVAVQSGYAMSTFSPVNYNAVQFTREVLGVSQEKGTIYVTDIGTSYNTTSDKEFKVDDGILTADQAWDILRLIEIHKFTWKVNGAEDIGVFAQDLYEIYPRAVTAGGWFDEAGDPATVVTVGAIRRPWSVDLAKLMPLVVTALQDLHALHKDHEQRLAALEAVA